MFLSWKYVQCHAISEKNGQKIAEKNRKSENFAAMFRLDGLSGLKIELLKVEHYAHIHFAQKPREMP